MPVVYTDDLLSTIKRDSFLTTAQTNFTDAQLLGIARDHLDATLIPLLLSLREGFFRKSIDVPFVANQASYTLPTKAMYGKLESVQYIDGPSGQIRTDQLTRIEIENLGLAMPSTSTGTPVFFTVDSSAITVYPTPNVAVDSMRVWYDQRPGTMVVKASAAQVLSLNTTTGVVTFTAAPPATFTSSSSMDFYHGTSPYQLLATLTATAASGSTQTFNAAALLASGLAAGDWVNLEGETVFMPIPQELKPYLSDLTIASLARTQQDANLYQAQVAIIAAEAKNVLKSTGNRLPGNPKKIRMTNPLVRNRSWSGFR
jgi:hypothetical protein